MSDNTTTALIVRRPTTLGGYQPPPERSEFEAMIVMANNLAKAHGFIPTHFSGQPYKVLAAILFARDLGLTATYALQHLFVVDGKVGMDGLTASSLIWRAGHTIHPPERVKGQSCTVRITRGDTRETFAETFTTEDAKVAGLLGKDPWRKYVDAMLYWRALLQVARTACPDALGGVSHTAEELGADVNDQGEPITNGSTMQSQGDIPLSRAAAGQAPGVSEVTTPSQESTTAIQPTPPAPAATPTDEPVAGQAEGQIPPSVAAAPAPNAMPVAPLAGANVSRRLGPGRSISPVRRNVTTVQPVQAAETPATVHEMLDKVSAPVEAVPSQLAPPALTDEPVLPPAPEPEDPGKAVYLNQLRGDLRIQTAELFRVNVLLDNVKRGLEGKEPNEVPPPTPSEASDQALAGRIDQDFPGRRLENLHEEALKTLMERFDANLAKKRSVLKERGISEE